VLERTVAVAGPFRLDLALRYLATSPSTVAEVVDGTSYERALRTADGPVVVRAEGVEGALRVGVSGPGASPAGLAQGAAWIEDVFGLRSPVPPPDPTPDPVMAERMARYRGLRILTIPDPFEALVWAILGQQIKVAFAARLKRVLIEAYGEAVEVDGRRFWLFPPPERLVDVTPEILRPLQVSRQKAVYIRELARSELDLAALRGMPDDEVVEQLVRIKGIGRWTAEYLLLRGFGRTDAIPAGDMGLRAIIGRLYGIGRNATEAEVRELADAWAPWRGYAAFYLWFALQQRDF
jgi:DNA-3-methyladenine glycosylase II